ncbi:glycerophosphodiester phosphodiesterase family protein, partial [Vibrio parahaemolyticus]|nr:glycerophosphodiester phosphodiesterase family protein [Vibrio parahaemolyticus]
MYQAPFTQIYRVVTNTLAQPWQTVAMSSDLDAERQRMVDKTHGSLEWIAHRGNNTNFPENSTVAFENVKRHWGIETDIHLTSDGKWVVMHDETVDRTTNGTGKITEMTYTQFRALRIDTGPNLNALSDVEKRPPDLDEYLAICKNNNKIPVLELKASSNYTLDELKKIKSLADDFGITNKIVFISFSYDVL